jgi:hypothetical protein
MIMDAKNPVESRVVVAASIAFLCACGARSEVETTGPAATPSSGDHGCDVEEAEIPGCVLHASHVNGADLGPMTLTITEAPPGLNNYLVDGYWVEGSTFSIHGKAGGKFGGGPSFRLWSNDVDALACGTSLPLGTNEAGQDHVVLRWWATGTDYWESTSGTLDVVAYEPGVSLEQRPIHVEVHGAPMAPGPPTLGGAPNNATGTFTVDLSCRLEKFWHIPSD